MSLDKIKSSLALWSWAFLSRELSPASCPLRALSQIQEDPVTQGYSSDSKDPRRKVFQVETPVSKLVSFLHVLEQFLLLTYIQMGKLSFRDEKGLSEVTSLVPPDLLFWVCSQPRKQFSSQLLYFIQTLPQSLCIFGSLQQHCPCHSSHSWQFG